MIGTLIRWESVLRSYRPLAIGLVGLAGLTTGLVAALTLHNGSWQEMESFQLEKLLGSITAALIVIALLFPGLRNRHSHFIITVPVLARESWLAQTIAIGIWGLLTVIATIGIAFIHLLLLMDTQSAAAHIAPMISTGLSIVTGFWLVLAIVRRSSPELYIVPITRSGLLKQIGFALGIACWVYYNHYIPIIGFVAPLLLALYLIRRTYQTMPPSFLIADQPTGRRISKEPNVLSTERWHAVTQSQPTNAFTRHWIMVRTVWGIIYDKWSRLFWLIAPIVLFFGLVLQGSFLGTTEDIRFDQIFIVAYVMLIFVKCMIKNLPALDYLPISRKLILAVSLLPAAIALGVGYGAGSIIEKYKGEPAEAIFFSETEESWQVMIPPDFFKISWGNEIEEITAPWGESHPPMIKPLFDGSRISIYKPFTTPPGCSKRFVAWQISRAAETIYGQFISPDEIAERYLIERDNKVMLRGDDLTLNADNPELVVQASHGVTPVLIGLALLLWLLFVGINIETMARVVSAKTVKAVFLSSLACLLIPHIALLGLAIGGVLQPWINTAFWLILIRDLTAILPGGAITIWFICLALCMGLYKLCEWRYKYVESIHSSSFPSSSLIISMSSKR